ncbi:hypothetical protein ZWY2020_051275 [Hordeum vulgare]|nr:hypothetical protein ZWY2020_051275 [Hordeum vulgare]
MVLAPQDGAVRRVRAALLPVSALLDSIFPRTFFGVAPPFGLLLAVLLLLPWLFSVLWHFSSFVVFDERLRSSTAMTPSHSSSVLVVAPDLELS